MPITYFMEALNISTWLLFSFVVVFWGFALFFSAYAALCQLLKKVVSDIRDVVLQLKFHPWDKDGEAANYSWDSIKKVAQNIENSITFAFNIRKSYEFASKNAKRAFKISGFLFPIVVSLFVALALSNVR